MRLLIIHPEARSFAGAERVLEYFLQGLADTGHQISVAVAADTKCESMIPKQFEKILIPHNGKFSLFRLLQELVALRRSHRQRNAFSVVHGWAARDWELSGLLGRIIGRPAIGTLHDHPQARFISLSRQRLMRASGQFGLKKVVCVSQAVSDACLTSGYPAGKLEVVHNGLPILESVLRRPNRECFRLGFLGVFAERKGLGLLFEILDQLARGNTSEWELHVAGDAQDDAGRQLLTQLKHRFEGIHWWGRIRWHGWLENPRSFLASLDLLVFPSVEFDPLPTVLLEAGELGVPALAARVGGVTEIVADNETGWLFDPNNALQATTFLDRLLQNPKQCREAGERARRRIEQHFPKAKMVAEYMRIYSTVTSDV